MDQKSLILDRIAEWLLLGVAFLLPWLFVPSAVVPFAYTKSVFLVVAVLAAFGLIVLRWLRDGAVTLPRSRLLLAAAALPAAYLLAALFAPNLRQSFMGLAFDIDTASFMLIGVLAAFSTALLFQTKDRIMRLYAAIMLGFAVLVLYQGARLVFGGGFLSFGIFTDALSTLLGKWHDLGIFFGLTALLSLFSFETFSFSRRAQMLVGGIFALSLLFLIIIDFSTAWIVLGLFAFCFFLFRIGLPNLKAVELPSRWRGATILALILLVVSLVFLIWGSVLGNAIANRLHTAQLEARPSWQTTTTVIESVYANHQFFLGSGPNTFSQDWARYRPLEVNTTPFWNMEFPSGIGIVPTSFATAGIVGGAAWIVFLAAFLWIGFRRLVLSPQTDRFAAYLSSSSYLAALYLWLMAVLYTPGLVPLFFAFLFTGIFAGSLSVGLGEEGVRRISFTGNPRLGFALVVLLSLLLLSSVAGIFFAGEKYVAGIYYQRALSIANSTGDLDQAEHLLSRALTFDRTEQYLNGSAQESLVRLNRVVADTSLPVAQARSQFQITFTKAVTDALAATKLNQGRYQNWVTLASVYQSVVPLKIEGAYENAVASYQHAVALNPNAPSISLALAQLSYQNGDSKGARDHIAEALQKKNDYTDAIFLLSQIEIAEGKTADAISSTQSAIVLDPQNPVLFFQLGFLEYNSGNYSAARDALESAVSLNASYSNARYFLGLAYAKLGRTADAIAQFTQIQILNPDNADVKAILANLKSGKDPLSATQAANLKKTTTPPVKQ